ncbi:MAG TPA: competence/damage-inducible protein A [Candidatus Sulfotelmatobacter sp.]|nr:competence/damage-inducible protein A [Candidatus Sulfotelmatobacter sp.]
MRIEIITVGNEVLSGRTLDTNFAFLARALEEASVQVIWHTTVGDTAEGIGAALRQALDRADAVVMTGGLGPTPDDLTRKAVASVLRRPLQLDEQVLSSIRARVKRYARKMPSSIETQALLPRGAEAWPNRLGTAPGILVVHRDKPVILLPGVPAEMEGLALEHLVPYLRERSGLTVECFTLRTYGSFESQLHERIGTLPQNWPNASLAYLPSYFGVDLRVTVAGEDADAVRAVAERAHAELSARVKPVIYAEGSESMEQIVGAALLERGWKIALAESCTGGLLAKRLTDTPGSSRYVDRGFVTYSNVAKVQSIGVKEADLAAHGAVSAPIAEQMARGARERAGVEVGIGITGIAGPDGGSEEKPVGLVFIAVSSPLGEAVRRFQFAGTRSTIRERSAQAALDLVRRQLQSQPLEAKLE